MFSENTTQVSQNDAFESSDFLYDINVDSFTGCHSRLYIYMFIPQLNKLVPMKIDTGSDISIFPGNLFEGQDDIEPLCGSFDATAANGTTIRLDKSRDTYVAV